MGLFTAIAGSVLGGLFSSKSQSDAADTQADAALMGAAMEANTASNALGFQKEVFAEQQANTAPYLQSSQDALAAYNYEMTGGDAPIIGGTPLAIGKRDVATPGGGSATAYFVGADGKQFSDLASAKQYASDNRRGGREYEGYTASAGFKNQLAGGRDAITSSAATRGMLYSGDTLQGLRKFGQDLAQEDRDQYMNRLAVASGMQPLSIANASGTGYANAASSIAQSAGVAQANGVLQAGNAQAQGTLGVGNAWTNALNGVGSAIGYAQGGGFGPNPGFGITPTYGYGSGSADFNGLY